MTIHLMILFFAPNFNDLYDKKQSAIRSFGHHVEEYLFVIPPQLDLIQTVSLPDDKPWTIQKPEIDLYVTHQKRNILVMIIFFTDYLLS